MINSIGGVVKILENPKQKTLNNNVSLTQFRAQFPQVRNNCVVHLKFWGNLALDVATYYKMHDYILIDGYLSVKEDQKVSLSDRGRKRVEITVLKIYPFLLGYDRSISSLSSYGI